MGHFALEAHALPRVVRVGQELEFRIKITGPAAWGMHGRPDLVRFGGPELGLRIDEKPDELNNEPPERSKVYRIRPTKAGEVVLPPVVIAVFDPAVSRFVSLSTPEVPIRVVAVPSLDPATVDLGDFAAPIRLTRLLGVGGWGIVGAHRRDRDRVARLRRRQRAATVGPGAARRYAARLADRLGADERASAPETPPDGSSAGDGRASKALAAAPG